MLISGNVVVAGVFAAVPALLLLNSGAGVLSRLREKCGVPIFMNPLWSEPDATELIRGRVYR